MLELKDICVTFNKGTPDQAVLFEGFNLNLRDGDFVSVIGSNGSGKTTLLNLICGTLYPDSGSILYKGREISPLREHRRARVIGRVFQDPKAGTCDGLTILENMALADNKKKAYGITAAVNKKRIDHYRALLSECEMGLENRLTTPVESLSGGQRQALALVIAGMTELDLLILDEHTAALDPKSSETIMLLTEKLIREKGITTLMVTHNLRHALKYGNRLLMMDSGKLILDKRDKEKEALTLDEVTGKFYEISIEKGN